MPQIAANVISLSLFRFGKSINLLMKNFSLKMDEYYNKIERKFEGILELYVAETITARLTKPCKMSKAELQVNFFINSIISDQNNP